MTTFRRVTLKDIADKAGVHHTTVSLALRNRPELPEGTRHHLQQLAQSMGYQPDPAARLLRNYHRAAPGTESRYSIAFLTSRERPGLWRQEQLYLRLFSGISRRATDLGYHVDDFWYDTRTMSRRRVTQILRARNIRGLLISGSHLFPVPDLEWEHFSCVALTRSLQGIPIHVVTNNHSHTIRLVFQNLRDLGYRRIGLAMQDYSDLHVQRAWSCGFLGDQALLPARQRIPPLLPQTLTKRDFLGWRRRHRPDAVITIPPHLEILEWLQRDGLRVPKDIGFASLDCTGEDSMISGVYQNSEILGMTAVDVVAGLIQRCDLGWADHPTEILTCGAWVDGITTRPQHG